MLQKSNWGKTQPYGTLICSIPRAVVKVLYVDDGKRGTGEEMCVRRTFSEGWVPTPTHREGELLYEVKQGEQPGVICGGVRAPDDTGEPICRKAMEEIDCNYRIMME